MKISNKVKMAVAALAVTVMSLASMPVMAQVTCPANSVRGSGETASTYAECNVAKDETNKDLMSQMNTIINVALGVIGFVAVIMIIMGGVQYTTSAGDAGRVKKAKDTILYGIVGLVVALLAYAIVNFVLSGVFGTN